MERPELNINIYFGLNQKLFEKWQFPKGGASDHFATENTEISEKKLNILCG